MPNQKIYTTSVNEDKSFGDEQSKNINTLATICHNISVESGWWHDINGNRLVRNKGELLMLIVTEIAETMEGVRKGIMDDHLTHRKMEEVELADAMIRLLDYAGAYNLDIGGALIEKLIYNTNRSDHKIENRMKPGGKKI